MSVVEETEPQPKRRRGVVNEDSYQRNQIHYARVNRLAYVNYKIFCSLEKPNHEE